MFLEQNSLKNAFKLGFPPTLLTISIMVVILITSIITISHLLNRLNLLYL